MLPVLCCFSLVSVSDKCPFPQLVSSLRSERLSASQSAASDLALALGLPTRRPLSLPASAQPSPRPCPDPTLSGTPASTTQRLTFQTPPHLEIDRGTDEGRDQIWNLVKCELASDYCEMGCSGCHQPPTLYTNPWKR